ncbi:MAG: hypothetical protein ACRDCW_06710 [Sarcina sp.]
MAEKRILGTIGKTITVSGIIDSQPRRLGRLKGGRFHTVYSYCMVNVKTSEGKKFSHLWFDLDEPINAVGKIMVVSGRVSLYTTQNTSGTNLKNTKLITVKEKNKKKSVDKKKK